MSFFMAYIILYALASLAVAILVLSSLKASSRSTGTGTRAEPELIRFCSWCKRVEVHGVWSKLPLSELVPPGQEAERVTGAFCPDCLRHWEGLEKLTALANHDPAA